MITRVRLVRLSDVSSGRSSISKPYRKLRYTTTRGCTARSRQQNKNTFHQIPHRHQFLSRNTSPTQTILHKTKQNKNLTPHLNTSLQLPAHSQDQAYTPPLSLSIYLSPPEADNKQQAEIKTSEEKERKKSKTDLSPPPLTGTAPVLSLGKLDAFMSAQWCQQWRP